MDWNNVNLNSGYERDQNILDPYNFDTLLLELQHNIREINENTVKAEFMQQLENKIHSAKEVFNANLKNIVRQAQEERES